MMSKGIFRLLCDRIKSQWEVVLQYVLSLLKVIISGCPTHSCETFIGIEFTIILTSTLWFRTAGRVGR